ncbi:MAG: hypothetical protein ACPGVU_09820 [Limisphaerales bacterium]
MNPVTIGLIGLAAGIVLTAVFDRWWFRRKLRRLAAGIGQLFKGIASEIPPFRISLELVETADWEFKSVVKRTSRELKTIGYQLVGEFSVAQLDDRQVAAFVNPDKECFAVLFEHPETERVVVDITSLNSDNSLITTTNAPYDGLDRPEFAPLTGLQVNLNANPIAVIEIHEALMARRGDRRGQRIEADKFEDTFVDMYARLMDWRVDRGTISEEEVKRMHEHSGQAIPDDAAVGEIQKAWKTAIVEFVNLRIQDRFLRTETFKKEDWAEKKERVLFVHERMDLDEIKEQLAWHIVDQDVHTQDAFGESKEEADRKMQEALKKLEPAFEGMSARGGFRQVQPLLPEAKRYEHICKLVGDYPADVYLAPEDEGAYEEEDEL